MKELKYSLKHLIVQAVLLVILSAILFYFQNIIGTLAFIASAFMIVDQYTYINNKNKKVEEKIINLNNEFTDITKNAVFKVPFPLLILNDKNKISWFNTYFKDLADDEIEIFNNEVEKILDLKTVKDDEDNLDYYETQVDGKYYRFYPVTIKDSEDKDLTLLYGIDNTAFMDVVTLLDEKRLGLVDIFIDNYDEARNSIKEEERTRVFSDVENILQDFAREHNAYIRKYESDKFSMIVEKHELENIMQQKFSVLDMIKEIKNTNNVPVTLSIGASIIGDNPYEIHEKSRSCLDVALGRGGDQAVVDTGELKYFGGKNKAVEKRNKVKARVVSHALKQLIVQSSNVFIMGHRNPDMDSIGSSLGMLEACRINNKECYIILNEVGPQIENIYNSVLEEKPDYKKYFVKNAFAKENCNSNSLVIICDNHRRNSVECQEIMDIAKNIVVIDHHRRSSDYIKETSLTYLEPYASSASEMVTEVLFYMTEKLEIPKIVAEALLAGITVDTKNFFYQTGVRTFEAASILKRQGADSVKVKKLFKDDERTIKLKSDVIASSKMYKDNIAIGRLEEEVDESILVAAQSADDLLNILGVEASFVLAKIKDKIHVSARSLGKISVQLILEKVGGGGHLTSAGAQLECSMDEAEEKIKQAIDEYIKEDTDESYID
ncbi:MAG: DHH family phosphoesterase [Finegoldia magna]|uniref:DHH family phosphoesterase n=1 Tax=Finegoldia magna TaxID=1260 RepID=UPI001EB817D3|nr:DHH family phosphoesterase [Finegoldia magna]MBS5360610.1 DHH family phosphoesterase [Finegoldia magna]MDU1580140.1 DHH family phosphoesterase [Finegoldia magna]MDU1600876.1 DHH family phosphoesterase [Finegoldia magna]MDU2500127.1 DHH family phosphoesterase [Finegoldia magna]MDU2639233.1 DHH family phosphoesterase [Finegoldia magna]